MVLVQGAHVNWHLVHMFRIALLVRLCAGLCDSSDGCLSLLISLLVPLLVLLAVSGVAVVGFLVLVRWALEQKKQHFVAEQQRRPADAAALPSQEVQQLPSFPARL